MKTSKSIADEFLKRKAQEKTEANETVEVKAFVKDIVDEKLAEIKAEKEAEKSKGLEVHTTKPISELEEYYVEPVVPVEEKPIEEKPIEEKPIEEKPVREKTVDRPAVVKKVRVQAKPVEENPGKPVVKKRWYDRIRPFGLEDSE